METHMQAMEEVGIPAGFKHCFKVVRQPKIVIGKVANHFPSCLLKGLVPVDFAGAQALGIVEKTEAIIGFAYLRQQFARPIGDAIPDNENLEILDCLPFCRGNGAQDHVMVIEGRDDDRDLHHDTAFPLP